MEKTSFFRRMIEEKGLLEEIIEIEDKDNKLLHFMEMKRLIELIESTSVKEQEVVKITFSMIDFKNGDLMHYLEFLAESYVKANFA